MQYQLCRHIRTNGLQCKSPSLSEQDYCFFHNRLYRRHSPYRHTTATRGYLLPGRDLELTALEDPESVQLALSLVINALATGQLETKRATALLYGLQTASNNAARLRTVAFNPDIVRTTETTPDGLDLALPGNTYEPPILTFEEPDDEDELQEDSESSARPENESSELHPGFPDLDQCQKTPPLPRQQDQINQYD